jgi:hypothetical protein
MADDSVLDTRPQGLVSVVFSPSWWAQIAAAKDGTILQILHPELGWLSFHLSPAWANQMGLALVRQAAMLEYFNSGVSASTNALN